MQKLIFILLFILISSVLNADDYARHNCSRPLIPKNIIGNSERKKYNSLIENYKVCINSFIRKENSKVAPNINSINDAVNDWNNFIKYVNGQTKPSRYMGAVHSDGTNYVGAVSTSVLKF